MDKLEDREVLLTSCQNSAHLSICTWDYNSTNNLHQYRNGGTISKNTLATIGNDFVIGGEMNKPLLHTWLLNSQEPYKNVRLILPEPATCLSVCPNNTYLAIGIGAKLYIWHLSSGSLITMQQKHYQPISCIKFSSDGDFVITAGEDGMLMTYRLTDLISLHKNYMQEKNIGQVTPLYTKSDNSLPIQDIYINGYGRKSRIVTVSSDHSCRIYILWTGELLLNLVFNEPLTSTVCDSGCWCLFVGCQTGHILKYSLKDPPRTIDKHITDNSEYKMFVGHQKKVTCLDLNMLGTILASGSDDGFVFLWEIKSQQLVKKIDHKNPLTNIKFIPKHPNLFVHSLKPKVILRTLERSLKTDDFQVSVLQKQDIIISCDSEDDLFGISVKKSPDLDEDDKIIEEAIRREQFDKTLKYMIKSKAFVNK